MYELLSEAGARGFCHGLTEPHRLVQVVAAYRLPKAATARKRASVCESV